MKTQVTKKVEHKTVFRTVKNGENSVTYAPIVTPFDLGAKSWSDLPKEMRPKSKSYLDRLIDF